MCYLSNRVSPVIHLACLASCVQIPNVDDCHETTIAGVMLSDKSWRMIERSGWDSKCCFNYIGHCKTLSIDITFNTISNRYKFWMINGVTIVTEFIWSSQFDHHTNHIHDNSVTWSVSGGQGWRIACSTQSNTSMWWMSCTLWWDKQNSKSLSFSVQMKTRSN
jgi:hypothetical protein